MTKDRHRRGRASAKSSLALHDRLERPAGLAGVIAQGGGDAGVAGQAQDGDGKVAQAGHDAWPVAGADLGSVLVVGDVPMQAVLDSPVAAGDPGKVGGPCLDSGERGDRVDRLC